MDLERALMIFANLAAAIPASFWLWFPRPLPRIRERIGRSAIAGIIALICYLFFAANRDLVERWNEMLEDLLVPVAPNAVLRMFGIFTTPVVYLFTIWLLSYVAAFQIMLLIEKRKLTLRN